jgi:hypothetical protein
VCDDFSTSSQVHFSRKRAFKQFWNFVSSSKMRQLVGILVAICLLPIIQAIDQVTLVSPVETISVNLRVLPVVVDYINNDSANFSKTITVTLKDVNQGTTLQTNYTDIMYSPQGQVTINLDLANANLVANAQANILVQMFDSSLIIFGVDDNAHVNQTFTFVVPPTPTPSTTQGTANQIGANTTQTDAAKTSTAVGVVLGLLAAAGIVAGVIYYRRRNSSQEKGLKEKLVSDQEKLAKQLDFLQVESPAPPTIQKSGDLENAGSVPEVNAPEKSD